MVTGFDISRFRMMSHMRQLACAALLLVSLLPMVQIHAAIANEESDHQSTLWAVIDDNLQHAIKAYQQGHNQEALTFTASAYLEGFELIEGRLDVADHELMKSIETEMAELRQMIRQNQPVEEVERKYAGLNTLLVQAKAKLTEGPTIAPGLAATSSGVILLREGTEAVLVIAALMAFLRKTGHAQSIVYIHAGWIAALLLGIVTWWIASVVIEISGAGREAVEGVVALLAAAMLIYVGYWLHDTMHAKRWKGFLHDKIGGALNIGQMWLLALVSFTAVYREVFETVLFYQALVLEAGPGSGIYLLGGGVAGLILLIIVALLIFHFSVRLPMRLFFGVNALIMVILALVIAGKGIAALQEAGYVPVTHVSFPEWGAVGIYANWESLGVQALMLVLVLALLSLSRLRAQHELSL